MKYTFLLVLIFAFSAPSGAFKMQLGDILKSAEDIVKSVVAKVVNFDQTPEEFYEEFRNVITGYPVEQGITFLSTLCSIVLSEENIHPRSLPDIMKMNYVLKTKTQNISVPLSDPEKLWSHEEFNRDWPLVIMINGWKTNFNNTSESTAADSIYEAYRCRGKYNFVTIDTADFVDSIYSWAAFNTEEIGNILSDSLKILIESYPIENIHLIGHSLGAQMAGSAGRNLLYKTGKLISRITGLDPANPCFNSGESLTGLYRGDASFVDIIHSNPGIFGKSEPLGDIDFYSNGMRPFPPGCSTISCAHGRAVEYYVESVYPGNEYNFMGVKCNSLNSLEAGFCTGKPTPMGFATPTNLKGNYFLKTNKDSPYGLNATKDFQPTCNDQ